MEPTHSVAQISHSVKSFNQHPLPPTDLTIDERKIWAIIRAHPGHDNQISRRQLVQLTGVSERKVRQIIGRLVEQHGVPIGSSPDAKHGGYYLVRASSDEDREIASRHLRAHAVSTLRRLRALDRAALKQIISEIQPELLPEPDIPHSQNTLNFQPPIAPDGCQRCANLARAGSTLKCQLHWDLLQ